MHRPRSLLTKPNKNFVLMVQQTGRSPGPNNTRVTRPLRAHSLSGHARGATRAHSWSWGSRLGNMSSRKLPFPRFLPASYCFLSAFFSASPNGTPNLAAGLRFHLELWKGVAACADVGSPGSSSSLPPMPSRPSWGSLRPWMGGWKGQRVGRRQTPSVKARWRGNVVGFCDGIRRRESKSGSQRARKDRGAFTFWGRGRRGRWAGRTGA